MKIRSKLLTTLLLLLCFLGSGIWLIERYVVIPKVESLEVTGLEAELERARKAIRRELEHIHKWAIDWGRWDETYRYVQDDNPDFIRESLAEGTLDELSMDFLLIVHADAHVFLRTTDRMKPLQQALKASLLDDSTTDVLINNGSGLITLHGMTLMVAASPVVRTDGSGPALGALYFGRMVDPMLVNTLEQVVSLDVSLVLDGHEPKPHQIQFPSEHDSVSQAWLPLVGTASHSLRIELRGGRPFLDQALASTYQLMGIIFVLGLFGTVATYFLLQHYLITPILNLQKAVLHFAHSHSLEAFDAYPHNDEVGALSQAFQEMASRLSADREIIINDRERLKHDSLTDPLTGLGNRRFLDHNIRHKQHWSANHFILVMYVDLDHFKRINDTYGHDVGDQILQEFAQLLRQCCREADLLVRTGGEEFLAVCELATIDHAAVIAERIRAQTEQHLFVGGTARLTCSIGLIVAPTGELGQLEYWERLFKVADMALYRAKHGGRNRWQGWQRVCPEQAEQNPLPISTEELQRALEQKILTPVDH